MNKRVHPLLDQSREIPALSPVQMRQALDDGVRVVDARSVEDFAGRWRSSVAASLMRAQGVDNVSDLAGGYTVWVDAHAVA